MRCDRLLLGSVAVTTALCSLGSGAQAQPSQNRGLGAPERVIPAPRRAGKPIPGRFIITLEPRANPRAVANQYGVEPDFIYQQVLTGFAGSMSELARSGLRRDNRVVRVEQDTEAVITQSAKSWGVDRVDQVALPLDGYYRPPATGRGVTVYVVDTGIRFDHALFGGRAVPAIDVINDGRNGSDCNGHGTHVAGTVAGDAGYGIAPGATVASARVLNCEGTGPVSGIIAALDWIAANARRPAVANLSLGGTASVSLDDAVNRLIASGVTTVVAAGNANVDACTVSPARATNALTVAATERNDARASFSNYGTCVDLFAPGDAIVSAYHSGSTGVAQMSGTSMAAPHVAGRAALLLESNPSMPASAVISTVISSASLVPVSGASGSPGRLVYVGGAAAVPVTATPTTTAGVTINGTIGNDIINATRTVSGQPLPTSGPDVIHGVGGNDSLHGLAGSDAISGGDGTDTLNGGVGDDRLDGGAGTDTASYIDASAGVKVSLGVTTAQATGGAGTDTLQNIEWIIGSNYADVITGNSAANTLNGGGGDDTLNGAAGIDSIRGGAGNDLINGGAGSDTLYGEAGRDQFRFNAALSASTNVDTISSFSVVDDTIELSRSIFTRLGMNGTLASSAFRAGIKAQSASDRVIYDSSTGSIYYDPDGTGTGAQVRFARVAAGVALTNADFTVVD